MKLCPLIFAFLFAGCAAAMTITPYARLLPTTEIGCVMAFNGAATQGATK